MGNEGITLSLLSDGTCKGQPDQANTVVPCRYSAIPKDPKDPNTEALDTDATYSGLFFPSHLTQDNPSHTNMIQTISYRDSLPQ